MTEYDRRYILVRYLDLLVVRPPEETIGETSSRRDGHGRQFDDSADVPQRVDVGGGRVGIFIDDDVISGRHLDPAALEVKGLDVGSPFAFGAQILHVGDASRRHEYDVGPVDRIAVVERDRLGPSARAVGVQFDPGHPVRVTMNVHTGPDVFGVEALRYHRIEFAEGPPLPHDEMHLGPQRAEYARELDGDVSRPHYHGDLRQLLQFEESVGRYGVFLHPGPRGEVRPSSRGDENLCGRYLRSVCSVALLLPLPEVSHRMLVDEGRLSPHHRHSRLVQAVLVNVVEASHVRVPTLLELGPVERLGDALSSRKSVMGGVVTESVGDVRGGIHDLLGDASDVDAGSAEAGLFDYLYYMRESF
mmetsp:Transcript_41252/g.124748  ORF Transcript_41252/g.124748 Transcript_41252/m.124748 type:complete len:360 (+) Transcript_41252:870-1949(+)